MTPVLMLFKLGMYQNIANQRITVRIGRNDASSQLASRHKVTESSGQVLLFLPDYIVSWTVFLSP